MAVQYWVGDFFVDLSRNQVTQKEQSQTIPPKALAVLTYLAQNQGKVVSYDEIFAKVWPDTVVTPNSLQRSIAQLRKVLDENSNDYSHIKTHAKQGYSLECIVRWHDECEANIKPEVDAIIDVVNINELKDTLTTHDNNDPDSAKFSSPNTAQPTRSLSTLVAYISLVIGLFVLVIIVVMTLMVKQTSPLSFDKLRALTASDDKENAAIYSPDGKFIVFHRYLERECKNNLWAKNIATEQEILLTQNIGSYGTHSFSSDGKKLLFVATEDCGRATPIEVTAENNAIKSEVIKNDAFKKSPSQKQCYNLVTLDFEAALNKPQETKVLVECKNSQLNNPLWLDDDKIIMMQKKAGRWSLIHYSMRDNKSKVIFDVKDGHLIYFDYSTTENLIAVTSAQSDGLHYIDMLNPDGSIVSSNAITFPEGFPKLRHIRPMFDAENKQLVFTSIKQLYTLSYEGKVTRANLPIDFMIEYPKFHPDGNRLLLIKKSYDSDIALVPFSTSIGNQVPQNHSAATQLHRDVIYPIVERSTGVEESAVFQPNGKLIAFISERSGEYQLWTTSGDGAQLISTFPRNTLIRGVNWAADGESLLVNANGTLTEVFLDGRQVNSTFDKPVTKLFHWDSKNNTALLMVRTHGTSQFGELSLNSNIFTAIKNNKKINWAQKSEEGALIFTDYLNRFWQPGALEDELIEPLIHQGSRKRFVIKNNVIYGINKTYQLWSYDLNTKAFEIISQLRDNVDYLTDINETDALLELYITGKKEVVEFSKND